MRYMVLLSMLLCAGCGGQETAPPPNTSTVTITTGTISVHVDGRMNKLVLVTKPPTEEDQAEFLELLHLLHGADQWMTDNPEVKIRSVIVTEHGGGAEGPKYRARLILLKE